MNFKNLLDQFQWFSSRIHYRRIWNFEFANLQRAQTVRRWTWRKLILQEFSCGSSEVHSKERLWKVTMVSMVARSRGSAWSRWVCSANVHEMQIICRSTASTMSIKIEPQSAGGIWLRNSLALICWHFWCMTRGDGRIEKKLRNKLWLFELRFAWDLGSRFCGYLRQITSCSSQSEEPELLAWVGVCRVRILNEPHWTRRHLVERVQRAVGIDLLF